MAEPLSHEAARAVYDRMGRFLDTQSLFERRFKQHLIRLAELAEAHFVIELGCGTGTLARQLLGEVLPSEARYLGLDQSETMVGLSRERIASFGSRAAVRHTDGAIAVEEPDGVCDRFLSTYVLDLLSEEDIDAVIAEAHRLLVPGGLLCLADLTRAETPPERVVMAVVERIWSVDPRLMGGCRPVEIAPRLAPRSWSIRHRIRGSVLGVPSEVIVAERLVASEGGAS